MENSKFLVSGQIVDIIGKRIFGGELHIQDGRILQIVEIDHAPNVFIAPGFINAHVHIESSMLSPVQFSKLVIRSGTVAVVSDPHEIVNVCGLDGFNFMHQDSMKTPLKIYLGAPSCVPATQFETSGAIIDTKQIKKLIANYDLKYLSEMMNFPGVIFKDPEVIAKLNVARELNLVIDGHAPGLSGKDLKLYVEEGITTDHECTTKEEAIEKIKLGMKILIREGSAAKDFENLYQLIDEYPNHVMLCTDDSHPDDLIKGHINLIVAKALSKGLDFFNVLKAASLNAIEHYKLNVGLLQIGDMADFIVLKSFDTGEISETYIEGKKVFDGNKVDFPFQPTPAINNFNIEPISLKQLKIKNEPWPVRVIEAYDGTLLTGEFFHKFDQKIEYPEADLKADILKIVVINRYNDAPPSIGFVKNFNLKAGAIASCIAHDSHNIIAIGTNDKELLSVINKVIHNKGGIAVADGNTIDALSLPIGGILTNQNGYEVAEKYLQLQMKTIALGSNLKAPFMTLSFLALLVIPNLKIGDKGLFDVNTFQFTSLFDKNQIAETGNIQTV